MPSRSITPLRSRFTPPCGKPESVLSLEGRYPPVVTLADLPLPPAGRVGWPWTESSHPLLSSGTHDREWPLVSIVTPSYNQAEFLEETIRSVLLQGYPALEYIIIDGDSTDGSKEIISKYERWLAYTVSESDRGQANALNKGFRQARGDILGWLNSDDILLPGTVADAQQYLAQRPDVGVVYGDVHFTDADSRILNTMRAWDFDLRLQVCATNLLPQPSTFFVRAAWNRVAALDERAGVALDYDLWVRMALAGVVFSHHPAVWATYRLHPASKTQALVEHFGRDVRRVISAAFEELDAPRSWRAEAESNCEQLIAENYLRTDRVNDARRHFWRAIRHKPFRLKTVALLAFMIDPRVGRAARRVRWLLAGRLDKPWQMPKL